MGESTVRKDLRPAGKSAPDEENQIAEIDEIAGKSAPKPHVTQAAGDNEWYTPPEYIAAAGSIPPPRAQNTVRTARGHERRGQQAEMART